MKFLDWLLTVPQYIAPQRSLSKLVWRLSRLKHKTLKSIFIRFFRVAYNVDLAEAIGKRTMIMNLSTIFLLANYFPKRALHRQMTGPYSVRQMV